MERIIGFSAAAALGVSPQDLIEDLNTFGLLFETMCIRDLRVFAEVLNGSVYHFRDKTGLECDAVIHLRNGVYGRESKGNLCLCQFRERLILENNA